MKNKFTVSIGIPAHNEEKSINNTINTLLKQKTDNFSLFKIIIFSDGSTDQTNVIIKNRKSKKIQLIESKKRIGKTSVIKKLLQVASKNMSDFLVVIDADLKIKDEFVLHNLVKKVSSDNKLIAVSGKVVPLHPTNLVQQLAYFGFWLHQRTIENSKNKKNYHQSDDALIILRVNEFTNARIKSFSYMHDEFYYLFSQKYNKLFDVEKKARVFFKQPTNLKDYTNQMRRYISNHMSKKEKIILNSDSYNIPIKEKIISFLSLLQKNQFIGSLYLIIQLYCHLSNKLNVNKFENNWIQIKSTK